MKQRMLFGTVLLGTMVPPLAQAAQAPIPQSEAATLPEWVQQQVADGSQLPQWIEQRRAELGAAAQRPAPPVAPTPPPKPTFTLPAQGTANAQSPTVSADAGNAAYTGAVASGASGMPAMPAPPAMPSRPQPEVVAPQRPEIPDWVKQRPASTAAPAAPQAPERPPLPEWVKQGPQTAAPDRTPPAAPERPAAPGMVSDRPAMPDWVIEQRSGMARPEAPKPPQAPVMGEFPTPPMAARMQPTATPQADAAAPARPQMPEAPAAPARPERPAMQYAAPEAVAPVAPRVLAPAVGYQPWGAPAYGGWGQPYGGWNNGWAPWGNNGGWGNSWMPWGNNGGWGNSWMPWGNNGGWGNSWMPWDNGWGGNNWGNNWMPWGNSWGGNGWNDGYGSGWGDGWGNTRGDGSADAAGDLDFSMALRGRVSGDMRGYGAGDGYGSGWGRGYGNQGYAQPYYPMPMPVPGQAMAEQPTGPADSDADGVADTTDLCPDTAEGMAVDALGCDDAARIVLRGVNFKTDSDELTEASLAILDGVSETLSAHPDIKVMVAGHTDSDGDDAYNKDLSQRRAQRVVDYLSENGVDPKNMIAKGYGEEQPIAGNDTAEGKAENRRVELNRL